MNIKLDKIELDKNILILNYSGICGVGSNGNHDVEKILKDTLYQLTKNKNLIGIIYNFKKLRYKFGNRFAQILDLRLKKNKPYIRIIPHLEDLANWKSLQVNCSQNRNNNVFKFDIKTAICSITAEMKNPQKQITMKEYSLFCKYGSELLWVSDSLRNSRPKETNAETDEMFTILEQLDELLEHVSLNIYSTELIKNYNNEIILLKGRVSKEVFETMKRKYII